MNHCETCQHWKQEIYGFDIEKMEQVNLLVGDSATGNKSPEWGECQIANGSDGMAQMTETLVFAQDCSGYHATLSTHKDFGCILHEEKK
jgi:hypothetical protein